jgi:hypothetical protein
VLFAIKQSLEVHENILNQTLPTELTGKIIDGGIAVCLGSSKATGPNHCK